MSFDSDVEEINRRKLEAMMKVSATMPQVVQGTTEGKPMVLTDATFFDEVAKQPVMLVDFWAPWCGPCRLVGPIVEELASEYAGRVAFGKLNVDDNPQVSQTFGIQSIPTLLIFKNGQPVDGVIGAVPKAQLERKLTPFLGAGARPGSP